MLAHVEDSGNESIPSLKYKRSIRLVKMFKQNIHKFIRSAYKTTAKKLWKGEYTIHHLKKNSIYTLKNRF